MKAVNGYIILVVLWMLNSAAISAAELPVLPYPQHVEEGKPTTVYSSDITFIPLTLDASALQRLKEHWGQFAFPFSSPAMKLTIGIAGKDPALDERVKLNGDYYKELGKEGYILIINSSEKILVANTETGLFYGLQTLKQLVRAGWSREVFIADWPSFEHRAVYDDISRGPISTVAYIKQQIDRLAELKINALSFYIEHVVQPLSHPDFAPVNGKLTMIQIRELSAYAKQHHMQLVGSFQSFGHFEKILALPQYKSMGETSTLISPLDPKARKFLEDVIGELCDAFDSPYFNVNCDETFDLGKGRSKKYIDSIGADRFYADHIRFLHGVLKRHNKKMMMWGDIALEHESILDMLPDDITYLTWEYGELASYDKFIRPFAKRHLNFMVCPGVLNSYRMFPDMVMAKANINTFLNEGKRNGAAGVVTTVWDDGGNYLFSGDWYGIYAAAEKSWNVESSFTALFNERYGITAYGSKDGNYVKALFKLMELRSVPLTYNLNDQVWRQKLLPEKGHTMIVNNSSAKDALKIIGDAENLVAMAMARFHKEDLATLKFSITQYRLIIESRLLLAGVAGQYETAQFISKTGKAEASDILRINQVMIQKLENRYITLKKVFKQAWLKENQAYWLDIVLAGYDKKIADLKGLADDLKASEITMGKKGGVLSPSASLRLDIRESTGNYFQNWMLGGPFPLNLETGLPGFLYSENSEYNKPPSPGDFTRYLGKSYRWQKFASQDGGIIDLEGNYHQADNVFAYAYCSITAAKALSAGAFISGSNGMEVFCNGDKVFGGGMPANQEERNITLPLNPGINHLLLKIPAGKRTPWAFTFRLEDSVPVVNHKHKYKLESKIKNYEAD